MDEGFRMSTTDNSTHQMRPLRMLLLRHWLQSGPLLATIAVIATAFAWIIPLSHPGAVLFTASFAAISLGIQVAGKPIIDGDEVFWAAMPVTPLQRYLASTLPTVLLLLMLIGLGLMAYAWNLPQFVWENITDGILPLRNAPENEPWLYPAALMTPFTLLFASITAASSARSANRVTNAAFAWSAIVGGLCILSSIVGESLWGQPSAGLCLANAFLLPALMLLSISVAIRKEPAAGVHKSSALPVIVIIVIFVLFVLFFFVGVSEAQYLEQQPAEQLTPENSVRISMMLSWIVLVVLLIALPISFAVVKYLRRSVRLGRFSRIGLAASGILCSLRLLLPAGQRSTASLRQKTALLRTPHCRSTYCQSLTALIGMTPIRSQRHRLVLLFHRQSCDQSTGPPYPYAQRVASR